MGKLKLISIVMLIILITMASKAELPKSAVGSLLLNHKRLNETNIFNSINSNRINYAIDHAIDTLSIVLDFESYREKQSAEYSDSSTGQKWGARLATKNEQQYGVMHFIAQALAKAGEAALWRKANILGTIVERAIKRKKNASEAEKRHLAVAANILNNALRKLKFKKNNDDLKRKKYLIKIINKLRNLTPNNNFISNAYIEDLLTNKKGLQYFNDAYDLFEGENIVAGIRPDFLGEKAVTSKYQDKDVIVQLPTDIEFNPQLLDDIKLLTKGWKQKYNANARFSIKINEDTKPGNIDILSKMKLGKVHINLSAETRFSATELSKLLRPGVVDVDITHNSGNAGKYLEKLGQIDSVTHFNLVDTTSTISSVVLPKKLVGWGGINLTIKSIMKPSSGKFFKNLANNSKVYINISDGANQELKNLIDEILEKELTTNRMKFGFYAPGIENIMNLDKFQKNTEYKTRNGVIYNYSFGREAYVFTKPKTSTSGFPF